MFCRAFTGRSIARGLVLLRRFSTVGLFQNLTQLDPFFSTTSVALFLEKKCFCRAFTDRSIARGVSSSPQILNGRFVPESDSTRSFVFNDIGSFVP